MSVSGATKSAPLEQIPATVSDTHWEVQAVTEQTGQPGRPVLLGVGRLWGCVHSPCVAAASSLHPFVQAEGQLQHPGRRQSQLPPARAQALPGQSRGQLGSPAPCSARVSGAVVEARVFQGWAKTNWGTSTPLCTGARQPLKIWQRGRGFYRTSGRSQPRTQPSGRLASRRFLANDSKR